MNCLRCAEPMKSRTYEGIQIDECPSCFSVWLDRDEIVHIVQTQEVQFDTKVRQSAHQLKGTDCGANKSDKCPKCQLTLTKFQYVIDSGVFLERCPNKCGLWFDPGELERVQIIMEERNLGRSSSFSANGDEAIKSKKCPRDQSHLNPIIYENQEVDLCPICNGIWCDNDELYEIIKTVQQTFSEKDKRETVALSQNSPRINPGLGTLKCTVCDSNLVEINYANVSNVLIDRCPHKHGIWLDANEIEKIQILAETWTNQQDDLARTYLPLLSKAAKSAEAKYDEAIREGKHKARKGRFLYKLIS